MIQQGIESISRQKDTTFIKKIEKDIEEIYDIIKASIPDIVAAPTESDKAYVEYDNYKKKLKDNLIRKKLNDISTTLTNRFGVELVLTNAFNKSNMAYLLIPPLNSKIMSMAMDDIEQLFPKKQASSILWNIAANRSEKLSYNIIKNLRDAIKDEKFELDLKHAKVKGLEHTKIPIMFNFLGAVILNIKPDEAAALLLEKVGLLFTHLEYLYTTTNNNLVLLDTYLTERFNKQSSMMDALKIALAKTDTNVKLDTSSPKSLLESLDIYILRTYRFDRSRNSIKIDYEALSDEFVTLFGYGDSLSSALVKLQAQNLLTKSKESNTVLKVMANVLKYTSIVIMAIISLLIFGIFGLVMLVVMAGIAILRFVITFTIGLIGTLIGSLFKTDVDTKVTKASLVKRLDMLKLDLIKQLRQLKTNDKLASNILVSQIDSIKKDIEFLKGKIGVVDGYDDNALLMNKYDFTELQNEFIEKLSENELHYLSAKFSDLKNHIKEK